MIVIIDLMGDEETVIETQKPENNDEVKDVFPMLVPEPQLQIVPTTHKLPVNVPMRGQTCHHCV